MYIEDGGGEEEGGNICNEEKRNLITFFYESDINCLFILSSIILSHIYRTVCVLFLLDDVIVVNISYVRESNLMAKML